MGTRSNASGGGTESWAELRLRPGNRYEFNLINYYSLFQWGVAPTSAFPR